MRRSPFLHVLPLLGLAAGPAAAQVPGQRVTAASGRVAPVHVDAHGEARPAVRAVAVERAAGVTVDGRLDEEVWRSAAVASDFMQYDPASGSPATQRTEIRFAYDDEALFIGARMYDDQGAAGVHGRLFRRDQQSDGDYLELIFDTFHDHAGRTMFQVNPAGVKFDAGQASPNADPSWDPVWDVATRVDSLGWTAEMRIPFSQLRFPRDSVQTWGMQVWRYVERLNETDMWAYWTRDDPGGPRRFGHLEGVRAPSRRGIELLPYAVTRAAYVRPTQPGSPFQDASAYGWRVGGDVKALLTSTLTLDATINPDFGQVEVDPAVVNLTAFETFFDERRPFFVEGSGLFGFGGLNCFFCSNASGMSLFYSRRIGRRPQVPVDGDPKFSEVPDNTTILGAAKVTGRTAGGWQIGLLDAATGAESARLVASDDVRTSQPVEPLTNYFVGRVKRNFLNGQLTLGAMGTSVVRRLDAPELADYLPRRAEAAGIDWNWTWKRQTYRLMGNFALSQVTGDTAAILRLQQASARYLDRPDRHQGTNGLLSDRFDPSLTAMRGAGGYVRLSKEAGANRFETSVNVRTPGFEVNDLAFLTRADYVWMNANLNRQWTKPTRLYRRADAILGGQQQYDFDGDVTDRQLQGWAGTQLANNWEVSGFAIYRPETYDDRLTRGAGVVRKPGSWFTQLDVSTDSRRRVVVGTSPSYGWNADGHFNYSANLDLTLKPASILSVRLSPTFSRGGSATQYVTTFDDPSATAFHGHRVVFADLLQRTLSLDTRISATFTRTLTLEVFAQPFVASGDYSAFKEFVAPRRVERRAFDAAQLRPLRAAGRDSAYALDPDRDPATDPFTFDNPDFSSRSLRGNAVLRWEWRPGSTLFLVWQQQRTGDEVRGDFRAAHDAGAVFRRPPDNVFLAKVSYWFGR
ncbi:MAG TPA: DUF5916 domain-containing protein [Longimicrobiales bacterium]|nr:DUF5916 domain-containing protein [Longimicrobiales bacterium]